MREAAARSPRSSTREASTTPSRTSAAGRSSRIPRQAFQSVSRCQLRAARSPTTRELQERDVAGRRQFDSRRLTHRAPEWSSCRRSCARSYGSRGSPRWVAAGITGGQELRFRSTLAPPAHRRRRPTRPTLLRDDVPSGAILAVSFKDVNQLLARIQAEPTLRASLPPFAHWPAVGRRRRRAISCRARSSRSITLEVQAPDPCCGGEVASRSRCAGGEAAAIARRDGTGTSRSADERRCWRQSLAADPSSDDQPFKDAFAAADVPAKVTWLAYADIQRLAPILQALAALTGNGQAKPSRRARNSEVRDARRIRRPVRLDEQASKCQAHDSASAEARPVSSPRLRSCSRVAAARPDPSSGGADLRPRLGPRCSSAIDTDLGSSRNGSTVNALANKFPDKQKAIDSIKQQLTKKGSTGSEDLKPALGPELDLVMLDFAHPERDRWR